jgi:hypothetical protein
MKTSHRLKGLKGINEMQDKVVDEILEAYYHFRGDDENETINSTLAIIEEYKDMTSVYCAHCIKPYFCENCMPMKKRKAFELVEDTLRDQKENLPDIYK